jgi:homoserine kinase type II
MAVYTDVSFEDLNGLLADYDIGEPQAFKGIAEGVENSNFYLQTDRAAYILTLYEKRVHAGDLPYFLGLMAHLGKQGIACPLPVRSKSNDLSTILNNRPAAVLTFLNGVSLRKPDVEHCSAAGEALACMHAASRKFPLNRDNALSLSAWHTLAKQTRSEADSVQKDLSLLISDTLDSLSSWPRDLPKGIIHADLFPDNVLFMDGKISGLIDFYFACNDAFAYDIAVMLNAWCFEGDGAFNVTKSKALLASYQAHRRLTDEEIKALPILSRGAALRFLLTRLYDWLNPDPSAFVRPKDPRDYIKRLRFHRNVKSAAEYGA